MRQAAGLVPRGASDKLRRGTKKKKEQLINKAHECDARERMKLRTSNELEKPFPHVLISSLREDLVDDVTHKRKTVAAHRPRIHSSNICWERLLEGAIPVV